MMWRRTGCLPGVTMGIGYCDAVGIRQKCRNDDDADQNCHRDQRLVTKPSQYSTPPVCTWPVKLEDFLLDFLGAFYNPRSFKASFPHPILPNSWMETGVSYFESGFLFFCRAYFAAPPPTSAPPRECAAFAAAAAASCCRRRMNAASVRPSGK